MKKAILTAITLALVLASIPTQGKDFASQLCEYTAVDDKQRIRKVLKENHIKIRNMFGVIKCNGKDLLRFADIKGSLKVGDFYISKLPKAVLRNITLNNTHLKESLSNRLE